MEKIVRTHEEPVLSLQKLRETSEGVLQRFCDSFAHA